MSSQLEKIIQLLKQAGYEEDGSTRSQEATQITQNSYPLPGKRIRTGGRQRYRQLNSNNYATIRTRTVCLYQKIDQTIQNAKNIQTNQFSQSHLKEWSENYK